MTQIRSAFLDAAESAVSLLSEAAVAASWDKPSALAEFSVRGLAGHLASQVLNAKRLLDLPPPDESPIGLLEHYSRAQWVGAEVDAEINVGIRAGGEQLSAAGPADLVNRLHTTIAELRKLLPAEPADRVVFLPWTGWALSLNDFLVTRTMEIAVHSDDLAVSVHIETPDVPQHVIEPVLALLSQLAVRKHGQAAVLRALSRAERAPASIAAI